MEQKYINGDVVMYDNKIMVVKEPRDGSHFDLSCPKEGLVYCFVGVDDMKPLSLTPEILEKNGWKVSSECRWIYVKEDNVKIFRLLDDIHYAAYIGFVRLLEFQHIHQLQHLLFGLGINHKMEV